MGNCCAGDNDKDKEVNMQKDYKGAKSVNINQLMQASGKQKKDLVRTIIRI